LAAAKKNIFSKRLASSNGHYFLTMAFLKIKESAIQ
jgi:hypothetical protein